LYVKKNVVKYISNIYKYFFHNYKTLKTTMYVSEANFFLLQVDSVILKQTYGQNSRAKKNKTKPVQEKI
jgi:histidinol-phosphate/aromatic aminotransferase/cobyric acid decarboxylase-like protein